MSESPDTKTIQLLQVQNQSRIITAIEKIGTLLVVVGGAVIALKLGVIDADMMHVIMGYLGLRGGEAALRGPLSSMAGKMLGGAK